MTGDFNGDGLGDFAIYNGYLHTFLSTPMRAASASPSGGFTFDPGTIATHNLQCSYSGDSVYQPSSSDLVALTYTQLATPVFSLLVGRFTTPQTVSINGSGSGATYYYTSDGTTPTTNSTKYTGPFEISTTTTLKAIAAQSGFMNSAVSEASYTFAATPSFNPPPGSYSTVQTVAITDSTASSTIYYTVDGTTPTPLSTEYTTPVSVPANARLQAMAIAPNHLNSTVASGTYAAPGRDFTPGKPPAPQEVSPGGTATYDLSFTAVDGYSGTISLSCSGLPSEALCSFNPATLKFTGSGSKSTTLSISTTAPTAALVPPRVPGRPTRNPLLLCGLVALVCGFIRIRRVGMRLGSFVTLALLVTVGVVITSCGGGSGSSGGGGGNKNPGTPAGTYNITVTANDSANNLQHTMKVTLTVN